MKLIVILIACLSSISGVEAQNLFEISSQRSEGKPIVKYSKLEVATPESIFQNGAMKEVLNLNSANSYWSKMAQMKTKRCPIVVYTRMDGETYRSTDLLKWTKYKEIEVAATEVKPVQFKGMRLYPNPTDGILYVESAETDVTIDIFTIYGDKALSLPYSGKVDVSCLQPGAYIFRLGNCRAVFFKS